MLSRANPIGIQQYSAQFSSSQRRWLRDSKGRWGFITPSGALYYGNQTYHFDVSYWNDPTKLIGYNYLPVNNLSAANAGTYRYFLKAYADHSLQTDPEGCLQKCPEY